MAPTLQIFHEKTERRRKTCQLNYGVAFVKSRGRVKMVSCLEFGLVATPKCSSTHQSSIDSPRRRLENKSICIKSFSRSVFRNEHAVAWLTEAGKPHQSSTRIIYLSTKCSHTVEDIYVHVHRGSYNTYSVLHLYCILHANAQRRVPAKHVVANIPKRPLRPGGTCIEIKIGRHHEKHTTDCSWGWFHTNSCALAWTGQRTFAQDGCFLLLPHIETARYESWTCTEKMFIYWIFKQPWWTLIWRASLE